MSASSRSRGCGRKSWLGESRPASTAFRSFFPSTRSHVLMRAVKWPFRDSRLRRPTNFLPTHVAYPAPDQKPSLPALLRVTGFALAIKTGRTLKRTSHPNHNKNTYLTVRLKRAPSVEKRSAFDLIDSHPIRIGKPRLDLVLVLQVSSLLLNPARWICRVTISIR